MHPYNIVIQKSAVKARYEGGLQQFKIDYAIDDPYNYNEEDGELFLIASMYVQEEDISLLLSKGLKNKGDFVDFTVLPRYGDVWWEAAWSKHNRVFVWHKNTPKELVEKVYKICNATFDELEKNNINPFDTIV
jgi:hypothetical protein